MAGLGSWAVWERGDAANWQNKYLTLQSSYATTAQAAKDDAQKQIAADKAENDRKREAAISQAQSGEQQAKNQLAIYLQKENAASKGSKDLSRECFSVPIAPELLPGAK